jgi:hypothetical protein
MKTSQNIRISQKESNFENYRIPHMGRNSVSKEYHKIRCNQRTWVPCWWRHEFFSITNHQAATLRSRSPNLDNNQSLLASRIQKSVQHWTRTPEIKSKKPRAFLFNNILRTPTCGNSALRTRWSKHTRGSQMWVLRRTNTFFCILWFARHWPCLFLKC